MTGRRILIVDSEEAVTAAFRAALPAESYAVQIAGSANRALAEIEREAWDVAIVDLTLTPVDGLELLKQLRARRPGLVAVVMTPPGSGSAALAAREAGAYGFLEKPADLTPEKILIMVANALEHRALAERVARLESGIERIAPETRGAAGTSPPGAMPATLNLQERERQAILQALESTKWNKQAAAALLGLHRPTLYSKMRKHGIPQKRPMEGAPPPAPGVS
ncbi:MAG: response regulator [Candidatus Rokuibacteriota bacterium]